jgi:drug/metabolite transporter (DMT)-like permease
LVLGSVLFKRWAARLPLAPVLGVQSLVGAVVLLGYGLETERVADIVPGPTFYFTLGFNVLVVSIGALGLWYFLLRRGSAAAASALHFLMPPFGLLFGWLILGERPALPDLLGIVPIALGIRLVTLRRPGAVNRSPPVGRPASGWADRRGA